MRRLFLLGLGGIVLVSFIGMDVVQSAVKDARSSIRGALTKEVPLETRLAEARARIDAYAENIIEGEVAAANLEDMIQATERDTRALDVRTTRERERLVVLRAGLDALHARKGEQVVAAATMQPLRAADAGGQAVLAAASAYKRHSEILVRRQQDLERLRAQHAQTQQALQQARVERQRLAEEARVLEAEIASLRARRSAAQTRESVGNVGISSSGFAEADAALKHIRSEIRKQDKLLGYYEMRQTMDAPVHGMSLEGLSDDPATAIEEALAAYPAQR
jgi:septal ring factor EnvC (AmiA/AmiB activator)